MPVAVRSKAWVCGRWLSGLRVRIPLGTWMSVCCECCVLSDRRLCDKLITRPDESYRLRRPWPTLGCSATKKKDHFNDVL